AAGRSGSSTSGIGKQRDSAHRSSNGGSGGSGRGSGRGSGSEASGQLWAAAATADGGGGGGGGDDVSSEVRALLAGKFLYIMSNLIVKDWTRRAMALKVYAIEVLGALVVLLASADIGGFVPKVMATLNSALADPKATRLLRCTAYNVMCRFVATLGDAALAENLSAIVVRNGFCFLSCVAELGVKECLLQKRLWSLVSGRPAAESSERRQDRCIWVFLVSLLAVLLNLPFCTLLHCFCASVCWRRQVNVLPALMEESGGGGAIGGTSSGDGGVNGGSGSSGSSGRGSNGGVRQTAARLLHTLVVCKRQSLREHFRMIPFMPDTPELVEVNRVLREELGQPSLVEQLRQLALLLRNESAQVRLTALRHLLRVLSAHRRQLVPLVASGATVDGSVADVLAGLLVVSASEEDDAAREACAACLGELGAVDPARLRLRLAEAVGTKPPGDAASGGGSGTRRALAAPWETTVEGLALALIQVHLVPAFRAAPNTMEQDRLALGIQELLRVLHENRRAATSSAAAAGVAGETDSVVAPGSGNEAVGSAGGTGAAAAGPMPDWLADKLREGQVLEVVEPFWSTKYVLADDGVDGQRVPPFFGNALFNYSLERWLCIWARHLISRAKGPLRLVFHACRGSVRKHYGTAQFLLPHLLTDAIVFGGDEDRDLAIAELLAVVGAKPAGSGAGGGESGDSSAAGGGVDRRPSAKRRRGEGISSGFGDNRTGGSHSRTGGSGGGRGSGSGGSGGGGGIEHMATQAIFGVLDVLERWWSLRAQGGAKGWPNFKKRRTIIGAFLSRVPREALVTAAMRVRAHARALRYLELLAREKVRFQAGSGSARHAPDGPRPVQHQDGANGWLPVMSSRELSLLQAIWRVLPDEPDGMAGVEAARRASGVQGSLRQRIWTHEHAEEWAEALQGYEQAMQGREAAIAAAEEDAAAAAAAAAAAVAAGRSATADGSHPRSGEIGEGGGGVAALSGAERRAAAKRARAEEAATAVAVGAAVGDCNGSCGGGREDDAPWEEGELERGALRALMEVGHFEGALHQASGMMSMHWKRHLAPALLPLAVEAAWQLERWPLLTDLIRQCDDERVQPMSPLAVDAAALRAGGCGVGGGDAIAGMAESTADGRYQVALGRVVLRLREGRPEAFRAALAAARAEVMAGLGAASMESYQRVYPLLLRVHTLRELEQGFAVRSEHASEAARRAALSRLGWGGRLRALAPALRQVGPVLAARRAVLRLCGLNRTVAENWLALAKRARAAGRFEVAGPALHQAGRLGVPLAQVRGERLSRKANDANKCLRTVPPV
ncbi:unnamed protein product, partial [Phaeothamnion confervicola]